MDQYGKVVLRKTLKRAQLLPFIAQHPASLIGMEACNGAYYLGKELSAGATHCYVTSITDALSHKGCR